MNPTLVMASQKLGSDVSVVKEILDGFEKSQM